jgi:hypothetical protein
MMMILRSKNCPLLLGVTLSDRSRCCGGCIEYIVLDTVPFVRLWRQGAQLQRARRGALNAEVKQIRTTVTGSLQTIPQL